MASAASETTPDPPAPDQSATDIEMEVISSSTGPSASDDWAADNLAPGQALADYTPVATIDSLPSQPRETGDTTVNPIPPLSNNPPPAAEDENDPSAQLGVCGLVNIGNTCYMNASLQCLRAVPQLISHCLSAQAAPPIETKDAKSLEKAKTCRTYVHSTFTSLVKKLWCGQFSKVQPRLFKSTLGLLHSQFSGSRQHDSQEFIAMLLDSLHEHSSTEDSSFVSETFRGQLKNEVVCSDCGNVSVKEEPFVFLSLPLPGAYDRILELLYVCPNYPPTVTRLALKVCRYGSVVLDIKTALAALLEKDQPVDHFTVAEVLKGTIIRTLADSLPLDRLNSKRGEQLYVYDMVPTNTLLASIRNAQGTSTSAESSDPSNAEEPMETEVPASVVVMEWHSCAVCLEEIMDSELLSHEPCGGTLCTDCLQSTKAHQEANGDKKFTCPICCKPLTEEVNFKPKVEPPPTSVVVMEWHSCAVCLEEMVDSELLSHEPCGGILCSDCLQSTKAHQEANGDKKFTCPVCSKPLTEESDFKPISTQSVTTKSDAISLLLMTVLFRSSDSLVGHPLLRHLPTKADGLVYYKEITNCLPVALSTVPFTLKLTNDKGSTCSRCDYKENCPGCVVPSDGSSAQLKPGDHLTVQFNTPLTEEQAQTIVTVSEHESLSLLETRQLTLNDCLNTFAQRETLSKENSWFCPKCEEAKLAERILTVDQVPETLIIHLKRFIYHGREGNKVEGSVCFPMELSGVCQNDQTKLKLTACVCHTGMLHFGHYTAYSRHPVTGEWFYYNDSSSSKVASPDCTDSVYMLFYQKTLTQPKVEKMEFDDSAERLATDSLLRMFKPPAPVLPAALPIKRSNSDTDLAGAPGSKVKPEDFLKTVKSLKTAVCPW